MMLERFYANLTLCLDCMPVRFSYGTWSVRCACFHSSGCYTKNV